MFLAWLFIQGSIDLLSLVEELHHLDTMAPRALQEARQLHEINPVHELLSGSLKARNTEAQPDQIELLVVKTAIDCAHGNPAAMANLVHALGMGWMWQFHGHSRMALTTRSGGEISLNSNRRRLS